MKKLISAAALLMIAGLALPAIASTNDDDSNNKISIAFYFPSASQPGLFSLLGAGDAQGTAEVTSRAPYLDSEGAPRVRINKLLHFADGDVFLSTDGTFIASALTVVSSGTWTLTGGTGMYVNVSGGGNYHWCRTIATGNLVGAYSGKMKLD